MIIFDMSTVLVTFFTTCLHYMYKQYRGLPGMLHQWTFFQLIGPISLSGICHDTLGSPKFNDH